MTATHELSPTVVNPDAAQPEPTPARPGATHDVPGIEALRAVAAFLVVLTHVGFNSGASLRGPAAGWLARGDAGVAVFFVLSGFLLTRPWVVARRQGRPLGVRRYLRRRAVRLLPAYLVAVAGVWLLVPSSHIASLRTWVAAATLSPTVLGEPLLAGFSHTWSLGTEVEFYLALPLLVGLLGLRAGWRRPAVVLTLLAAGALAWRALVLTRADLHPSTAYWLPGYLDWFAAGIALAWLRERDGLGGPAWLRASATAPGAWWALAGCSYWVATTRIAGPYDLSVPSPAQLLAKHLLYLVFATALLVPVAFGPRDARWLRIGAARPVVWLGTISYGIFLWHMVVLTAVMERAHIWPFQGRFGFLLAVTAGGGVVAGAVSWYAVEAPCQRLVARFSRRRGPVA